MVCHTSDPNVRDGCRVFSHNIKKAKVVTSPVLPDCINLISQET